MKAPAPPREQVTKAKQVLLMGDLTRMLCELRCLDMGILGRERVSDWENNSIDTAFREMDPIEARKMKRRFRKVARRIIPRDSWKKMTRRQKRVRVMREIFMRAWEDTIKLEGQAIDIDV